MSAARVFLSILALLGSLHPARAGAFFPEKLAEIDQTIVQSISSNKLPGAVLWIERRGESYRKAYGNRAVRPKAEAMTEDTILDAASLTKVVATTPALMILFERGLVDFDAPV